MLQGKKASISEGQELKISKKYGTTGFMYTEYPHKRFWPPDSSDELFQAALIERFGGGEKIPTMLYLHIPYCQQLCWFCTCHISITQEYAKVQAYMKHLYREIAWLRHFFQQNRLQPDFREIHLGGGSPTFIDEPEFEALVEQLRSIADVDNLDEFAIEIDPRRVDEERMEFYAQKGINRISFGIQDFDVNVQKAVNRIQPAELTALLLKPGIRGLFKNGVNFDIICGLPNQTPETMRKTCQEIIEMSPDRICLNYLHFSPQMAKHQNVMVDGRDGRPDRLPNFPERKAIFVEALQMLAESGYIRTGYDHFAKPSDANALAMQEGKMGWNELGTTPGRVFDVIGIGVSSLSTVGDYYFQNFYELEDYAGALNKGQFPIYRGHRLTRDDIIRRDVIQTLRSFFAVDYRAIGERHGIEFEKYFETELEGLSEFVKDGLIESPEHAIHITELGHQFTNLVCRSFDKYYQEDRSSADLGERTDDDTGVQQAAVEVKNLIGQDRTV